jgi:DNA adenine methylase
LARKTVLYGKRENLHRSFEHSRFVAENVKKCKYKWLITCDGGGICLGMWDMKYAMYLGLEIRDR